MSPSRHRRAGSRPRPWAAIVALICVCLGAPVAAAQSMAERLIDDWATTQRAAGRTVEWSGLARSMSDDRVDLRDLAITIPVDGAEPLHLTVPLVSVVGLADRAGGGFTVTDLTLPRLALTTVRDGETVSLQITDLDLVDAVMPLVERPPLDHDHVFTSALAATRVFDPAAVGRASIGRLALTTGRPDGSQRSEMVAEGLALAGLAAGRVERLAVGRFTLDVTAAAGAARFSLADAEILAFDPTVWRRAFRDDEPSPAGAGGDWATSVRSLRTGRVSLESGPARMSIEAMRAGERRIRRDAAALGRMIDRLFADGADVARGDGIRMLLEAWLATRNDGWTIEGFHLTGPDLEHADVARISVGPFSGAHLADLTIDGIDLVGPRAILRLGRFVVGDLRLPDGDDLRRALQAAAVGAEIDPSSLMPRLGHLAAEGLEVAEPGVPALRLASLRLDLARHLRAVPTDVAVTLDHFVVPAGLADAEGRRLLGDLGYGQLDISAALRLAWTEADRAIAVDKAELAIAELGRIDLRARLTGVPPSLFLHPETAEEVIADIRLAEATATFHDASIVERLTRKLARDEKTKPERIRRRLGREIAALFADVRDPARRRRMVEEAGRFLAAPKAITLEARPRQPVPVLEVVSGTDAPADLIERLDVRMRAER